MNTFPIHTTCIKCNEMFALPAPAGFEAATVLRYYPVITGGKCPKCTKAEIEENHNSAFILRFKEQNVSIKALSSNPYAIRGRSGGIII